MRKKVVFSCLCCLFISSFFIGNIKAEETEKEQVELSKCVDGDTAYFLKDGEVVKTRFLAIDTPESTNKIEPYGKEASAYTCDALTSAKRIELTQDSGSDLTDKYDRMLVWVYVDGELLQAKLVKEGYAEVKYLYGDYMHTEELQRFEEDAKKQHINIWGEYEEEPFPYLYVGLLVFALVIVVVFGLPGKRKIQRELKKQLKKKR